ncbi:MAG: transcriptional regulator [Chloroflexota bacterium]|nr:MAG: transcriptional regulator [Chloroflexota bacterium]
MDRSRREIIGLLAERSRTVTELLEHFEFTQPALSKHLRLLREARLVAVEDDGRFRRYRFVGEALDDMTKWLLHYRRFWTVRLDTLGSVLDREAKKGRRAR